MPVTVEVKDPSGSGIAKARIEVVADGQKSGIKLETDAAGRVTLAVTAGQYILKAGKPGFRDWSRPVNPQSAVVVPVVLAVASSTPPDNLRIVNPADEIPTETLALPEIIQNPGSSPAKSEVLVIEAGPGERGVFTAASLREYPQTKVTVFDHHANKNVTYAGVPLMELLAHLGVPHGKNLMGKPLQDYVVATGSDGYSTVLSLGEVDPDFHPGMVLVADEVDGKPLDAKTGPFRLVVSEDRNATRSVWGLVKIEVRKAE